MKNKILISILFILNGTIYSQKQNNVWYFGDHAGLDFNSGMPVALTNGQLFSNEGCASISDNNGNLLFYTNGVDVWDRNHVVMPNGSGLMGDLSTTQSAVIVPDPGNTDQYYIFTLPPIGGTNGMRYSIVDMNLNYGNGDITTAKNIVLHSTSTEKVAAIARCDGSTWVISHEWNSNTFDADLITASGISPTVKSSVGVVHTGGSAGANFNAVGYLKASSQGNRLALAIRDMDLFQVFDFDITTGTISNPISLSSPNYDVAYGVEFSPDGLKLYTSSVTMQKIYQFDLSLTTAAAILSSVKTIATGNEYIAGLQIGPDQKIYVAREYSYTSGPSFVGVINNPNTLGIGCNYVSNGVALSGKTSLAGLPGFVVRTPNSNFFVSGDTTICAGQTVTLTAKGGSTYQWSGGSTSSNSAITVSPLAKTTYYVTGTTVCGPKIDSVTVNVNPPPAINISGNTAVCAGQSTTLTATGGLNYKWGTGSFSTINSITVTPTTNTTYTVIASDGNCSSLPVTIVVHVASFVQSQFTYQIPACTSEVSFSNISGASGVYWDFGDGAFSTATDPSHIYASGTYTVLMVVNPNTNCADSIWKTITVTSDSLQKLIVPNVFTPNDDGVNDEFKIFGLNICEEYFLEIYNRWGQKVFETKDPGTVSWNGLNGEKKRIMEGTYYYILIPSKNSENTIKGAVTLLR